MVKTSIAAPAIARDSNARMSAPSSTIGPREVLTSQEAGLMSASSAAPTSPRVRALSTRSFDHDLRVSDVIVEHRYFGAARHRRPVRHLERNVLIVVENRDLHFNLPRNAD